MSQKRSVKLVEVGNDCLTLVMRLFLLTLFTAFPLFLTAQSYLGLVVGTELSSFTVGGDGQELFYSHPRPGLLLGFTGGMPLKERLILHLEVNFATAKTELRRGLGGLFKR